MVKFYIPQSSLQETPCLTKYTIICSARTTVSRSSTGAGLRLLTEKGFWYGVLNYQNISDNESLGALRSSIISKIPYCIAAGKGALMTLIMLRN